MRTFELALFACVVVPIAACGGAPAHTEAPAAAPASAAPSTSAEPSPTPLASASSADATPTATGAAGKGGDKGPFHFTEYAGPKVKAKIDTQKVWAIEPVGEKNEWDLLKIMREDFGRIEGDEVVVKHFDGAEIFVPGALVLAAKPAVGLKKGDAVMADVAAANAHARVVSIDAGSGSLAVKYWWAGSASDAKLEPDQVVKMDDKVSYGAAVAWKKDGAWQRGQLAGGDGKTAFVLDGDDRAALVPFKELVAMRIARLLKKGDKVWASDFGPLVPGKITDVVDGGVAYKVKLDKGASPKDPIAFDKVTAPLE